MPDWQCASPQEESRYFPGLAGQLVSAPLNSDLQSGLIPSRPVKKGQEGYGFHFSVSR
ncbi:hypothetical protein NKJ72_18000 [Mesorhizobium sp. M0045]|uniref:Uncharacterized protein n=1 Tax=Mesorhizobium australicum TaxID=536018 RepID=A0ACC6T8S4_9HYPH|nr:MULTISPECIES: hypothetical protein [unclassified Mesorhizobium]ESX99178.1 hypothetical protein X753_30615 [Mesorhizobium sp. LNJC399B00]ESY26333.1 hypothetical protein X751_00095 [Mesorhizobium sp. LNJC395A00]WJI67429.1 hypothetical protein NLY36_21600 [Mesorhizobium sp. C399B]WJI74831.1 hypothetical protein NLY37_28580 [Mesorhizobium sp. C395A]